MTGAIDRAPAGGRPRRETGTGPVAAEAGPPATVPTGRALAGSTALALAVGMTGLVLLLSPVRPVEGTARAGEPAAAPVADRDPTATTVTEQQGGRTSSALLDASGTNPARPASPTTGTTTERGGTGQRPGTVRLPQGGTATLVRREVGPDGVLPVPDGVREATWWGAGLGADSGATLLAGHVDWRGRIGPFAELWRVRAGQEVTVTDNTGRAWRYRVAEVHTVHKNDLPARAAALFGQDGPHRLVLVTCGGRWVGGTLGYDENRIVVAYPA